MSNESRPNFLLPEEMEAEAALRLIPPRSQATLEIAAVVEELRLLITKHDAALVIAVVARGDSPLLALGGPTEVCPQLYALLDDYIDFADEKDGTPKRTAPSLLKCLAFWWRNRRR